MRAQKGGYAQQAPPPAPRGWPAVGCQSKACQALGQAPPAPGKKRLLQPRDTSVSPRSHREQKWEELLWKVPLGTVLSL